MIIFKKTYESDKLYNVYREISDTLDSDSNNIMNEIPINRKGMPFGEFEVSIKWKAKTIRLSNYRYIMFDKRTPDILLKNIFFPLIDDEKYIIIDLDGSFDYPPSFFKNLIEELLKRYGSGTILKYLHFVSREKPILLTEIEEYIKTDLPM